MTVLIDGAVSSWPRPALTAAGRSRRLPARSRTGLALQVQPPRLGPRTAPKEPLENLAKTAANSGRRSERLRARGVLRDLTDLRRVATCGHALGDAVVRLSGAEAGVAGLETCGSVWACPVCASKIASHRTADMEAGIRSWAAGGNSFVLLTLTMRHRKGQSLRHLWDGLSTAWRDFVSDGTYKRTLRGIGVEGFHRTTEVTLGAAGWHVHLHVLYFVRGVRADQETVEAGSRIIGRWVEKVAAASSVGIGPVSEDGKRKPVRIPLGLQAVEDAQDWKRLRGSADSLAAVAGYVHKGEYREKVERMYEARGIALEVTRSDTKSGRRGNRTPFGLLADIVESVEDSGEIPSEDMALWSEWEEASHGRRQQVWSRGLREKLGLGDEISDDEAAAVEVEGLDLVRIPSGEWRRFARDGRAHSELLAAVEAAAPGGFIAARMAAASVLRKYGCGFSLVDPPESA